MAGVARQTQIEDQAHDEHARDHIARENVADKARQLVEKAVDLRDADAEADGGCGDERVALAHACVVHHAHAGHHNRAEHDDRAAAEHAVGQRREERADGREQTAEDHRQRAEHDRKAVDNMGHRNEADVLAERRDGRAAEYAARERGGKRDGGDEKILPRAERIRRRRAERRNADIQNAQTDRDDHAGRDDEGDDLAPVLGRQAQHAFKAAADNDRADHDAVILRGRRKTGGEEREADAHDDRQT